MINQETSSSPKDMQNYEQGESAGSNCLKMIHEQLCLISNGSSLDSALDFKIQYFDYLLTTKFVTIQHHFFVIQLAISQSSGRQFRVPAQFRQAFYKIANKNAQHSCKFTSNNGQPILTCRIPIDQSTPISITVASCLKCMKVSLEQFEKAVTLIGACSKYNKLTYEMKKNQLHYQRCLGDILNNNKLNSNLDYFKIDEQMDQVVDLNYQKIQEMEKVNQDEDEDDSLRVGQSFLVKKVEVAMTTNQGHKQFKVLACKMPSPMVTNLSICELKLKREIDILSKIVNPKYSLKYYIANNQFSSLFIDYVPQVLKDYIHDKDIYVEDLIRLSSQTIDGVAILHKSGIIHRDLKPENILIERKGIKIIDFAESALKSQSYHEAFLLGSTLPYSPFQCRLGQQEGFNREEIDLWSIAMIIYEMAFKGLPVFDNQMSKDVLENWRHGNEFTIHPIYRKRKHLMGIGGWISLITIKGLQVNPGERLSLQSFKKLVLVLEQFWRATRNLV